MINIRAVVCHKTNLVPYTPYPFPLTYQTRTLSMSLTPQYGIFSHSVGYHTAGHGLLDKLRAIAQAGIQGVEIFSDDLVAFAHSEEFTTATSTVPVALLTPPDSPLSKHASIAAPTPLTRCYNGSGECTPAELAQEISAATYISTFCKHLGLEIYNLQPLRDIEGWVSTDDRDEAMARVESRFAVMKALDTHLLLICSNNAPAPRTTGDVATLARDFTQISDMAYRFTAQHGHEIRIGFEALSWGAHVDVWSQAWNVVRTTARDNIGLILDSFNTLGRQFADPCSSSGVQEPIPRTMANLKASLAQLTAEVPADKIFFLQIGDAKRMPSPLPPSPNANEPKPARMIWSRSSRLFPCEDEQGAFMPVVDFMRAVMATGFRGPWSIEVFNDSLNDTDSSVPTSHANRARAGLDKLVEQVLAGQDRLSITV